MEILLTGNTCFVTPAWVEMAFPEDHVLITCARGQPHPPRIRTITLDSKERIGQLVDSYEFDRIVYFSEYLTPHSEQEGELDRLRRVLQANRERPSQLLYLAGPEAVLTPFIGKSVLAQAAEALLRRDEQGADQGAAPALSLRHRLHRCAGGHRAAADPPEERGTAF